MLLKNLQASPSSRVTVQVSAVDLISSGWTFAAEPTTDHQWEVLGCKGQIVVTAQAPRLGEAFQEVERAARELEFSAN